MIFFAAKFLLQKNLSRKFNNIINYKKMDNVTFEKLPEAIGYLINKVESLETILQEKSKEQNEPVNQWFNLDELRAYLPDKPARATVYGWIGAKFIPSHKNGKRLRFFKPEIDQWLALGKRKSESELQIEAEEYFKRKGGRK